MNQKEAIDFANLWLLDFVEKHDSFTPSKLLEGFDDPDDPAAEAAIVLPLTTVIPGKDKKSIKVVFRIGGAYDEDHPRVKRAVKTCLAALKKLPQLEGFQLETEIEEDDAVGEGMVAHGFREISGPSLDDCCFLADRYDSLNGWREEDAESWIGQLLGGQLFLLMGQVGWITDIWRSPSGKLYASQGGSIANGVHINASTDPRKPAWKFHKLPYAMYGVWGLSDDFVLAWGGEIGRDGETLEGRVMRWDGRRWKELPRPPGGVTNLHGLAPDLVYAVCDDGMIARWDGGRWQEVHAPRQGGMLSSIHVVSPDEMYACGTSGQLLVGSSTGWSELLVAEQSLAAVVKHRGTVYVSSYELGLLRLARNRLVEIDPLLRASRLDARGNLLAAAENELAETKTGKRFLRYPIDRFDEAVRETSPMWRRS